MERTEAMEHTGMSRRPAAGAARLWPAGLRVAAAGLLAATGAIHLHLYLTGYRTIPTIGWMFLLQVISAFVLAAAMLATALPAVSGRGTAGDLAARMVALAAAGFGLATLLGYLLSIWVGLFGFREIRTTTGIVAAIIEIALFAVAAIAAVRPSPAGAGASAPAGLPAWLSRWQHEPIPWAGRAVGAFSLVAVVLVAVAVAGAGGGAPASASGGGNGLTTETVGGQTVLANAKGFTLYLFVPDKTNHSVCNGSCAQYWPPVPGHAKASAAITGKLITIKRSGGTQASYDGHPLYTYIGDNKPGQATGNNINLNGGLWRVVPVSG
jgi:predicted lipoprotein with Yx(FWY)xxD motif